MQEKKLINMTAARRFILALQLLLRNSNKREQVHLLGTLVST